MCPLLGLFVRHFAGDFNTHWPDSWRHNFSFRFQCGLLSFISSSEAFAIESKIAAGIQIHFRCFDWEYLNLVLESSSRTAKLTTRWEGIGHLQPTKTKRDGNSLDWFSLLTTSSSFWPSCWPQSTWSFSYNTAANRPGCNFHNCSARVLKNRVCVLKDNRLKKKEWVQCKIDYIYNISKTKRECLLNIVLIFSISLPRITDLICILLRDENSAIFGKWLE